MARRLRMEGEACSLGLVPVEQNVGVATAALQLAVAFNYLAGSAVSVVDCNTQSPAWRELVPAAHQGTDFEVEVSPKIRVVTVRQATPTIDFEWCARVIQARRNMGHFVVCDLTGFALQGALGSLNGVLDGLVSVVQVGRTLEWKVAELHREFPQELDRGVLFLE